MRYLYGSADDQLVAYAPRTARFFRGRRRRVVGAQLP